jgi:hypothetical protein
VETEIESKLGEQQLQQQLATIPPIKFKSAFEELSNKYAVLNCGIPKNRFTIEAYIRW